MLVATPLVAALVLSSGPNDLIDDFDLICERAQTAPSKEAFAAVLHIRLKTEAAENVLAAASAVPDNQKLETFRLGAHAVGLPRWDCPDLSRLFGPQRTPPPEPPAKKVHARVSHRR